VQADLLHSSDLAVRQKATKAASELLATAESRAECLAIPGAKVEIVRHPLKSWKPHRSNAPQTKRVSLSFGFTRPAVLTFCS
jgi:hypothetical protein